jgi:ubiquinone/menaquinone biosynthesis C-methylase UbiE
MSVNPDEKNLDDRRAYYDDFSAQYERGRDKGYHAFLDRTELGAILPKASGKRVLEAGCGTGILLHHVANVAKEAVGVDLSTGMMQHARSRGLNVVQGDLLNLPFEDDYFDVVYSCKVLAHVPNTERVLAELDRVTRPGGRLLLEFYNRRSVRYLVRKMRPGISVSGDRTDADVYTRFDTEKEVVAAAPDGWRLAGRHGIRVATLVPQLFKVPGLGVAWEKLEAGLTRSPLGRFGGFLLLDFEKSD